MQCVLQLPGNFKVNENLCEINKEVNKVDISGNG